MRGVLFDMDGVLYNSEAPIPGAAEAVAWVQARNIPHLFVTNTTSRGRDALVEKLERFGIRTKQSQILTPCTTAADWLRAHASGLRALFVTTKARVEFQGLACLPEEAETGAQYVVIGDLGDAWNFRALNRAFRLLHSNPEADAHCAWHDEILARPRWPSARRGAFHRGARARHRTQSAGFRKTGPAFFPRRRRTVGLAGQ